MLALCLIGKEKACLIDKEQATECVSLKEKGGTNLIKDTYKLGQVYEKWTGLCGRGCGSAGAPCLLAKIEEQLLEGRSQSAAALFALCSACCSTRLCTRHGPRWRCSCTRRSSVPRGSGGSSSSSSSIVCSRVCTGLSWWRRCVRAQRKCLCGGQPWGGRGCGRVWCSCSVGAAEAAVH